MIDPPGGQRRVRCRSCGWLNGIPRRVYTRCTRCNHEQHVRFSRRDGHCLCVNCGHALEIREVELVPLRCRGPRRIPGRRRSGRRESIAFTIVIYAIAVLVALLWFSRQ